MQSIARWEPLVLRHGLRASSGPPEPHPSSRGQLPTWEGMVAGVPLTLEVVDDGRATVAVTVLIGLPKAWATLSIASARHTLALDRVTTGDPDFDAAVVIRSDDYSLLGLLDERGRARLAELVQAGVSVHAGCLRIPDWATRELSSPALDALVDAALDLARALATPVEHRIERLIKVAGADPVDGVRTRYSELRSHPAMRDTFARHTATLATADDHTFESLRAQVLDAALPHDVRVDSLGTLIELFPLKRLAPLLGRVEPPVLFTRFDRVRRALSRSQDDREVALELMTRLSAVAVTTEVSPHACLGLAHALGDTGDARAAKSLGALVTHRDRAVRIAALESLVSLPLSGEAQLASLPANALGSLLPAVLEIARRKAPLGAPLVAAWLPRLDPRNNVLQVGTLNILAASGDETIAPSLVPFLESPYEDVQVAAIEALGAVGPLAEVGRLTRLTEGLFRASDIKSAAKAAVARLRERHQARSIPGAVSLAADPSGALSVASDSDRETPDGRPPDAPPRRR